MRREEIIVHERELYLNKFEGSCPAPGLCQHILEGMVGARTLECLGRVRALQQLKEQGRREAGILQR
uniref:Uncharacterized protein n=1 Tax=Arundo donax TaxID=35708 RepID=A0A0A8YH39_ARUDO